MPALFSVAAPDRLGLRAPPHELSLYELSLSVDISRHGRRASPSRILLTAISVYPVEGGDRFGGTATPFDTLLSTRLPRDGAPYGSIPVSPSASALKKSAHFCARFSSAA